MTLASQSGFFMHIPQMASAKSIHYCCNFNIFAEFQLIGT